MIIWIIFGVLILVSLTALLSGFNTHKPTREEFLQKLAQKWEGKVEPVSESENTYMVKFLFDGQTYIFEDRESKGFNGVIYQGSLKVPTGTSFNLYFVEKEKIRTMRAEVTMASKITDYVGPEVELPPEFKAFRLITSRPYWAQALLNSKKIAAIFKEFQNVDSRGIKSFAIKIMDGEVILDFHTTVDFKPNLPNLRSDPALMENYINKIGMIAHALRKLSEDI